MHPLLNCHQAFQTPEASNIEFPRGGGGGGGNVCTTAEECAAKIHKTTIRHFVFTEKVCSFQAKSVRGKVFSAKGVIPMYLRVPNVHMWLPCLQTQERLFPQWYTALQLQWTISYFTM